MSDAYDYDVIIVGGRPAGSTLAARLGMAGVRVLLLERAQMPVLPGASCPIIYASTMRMLDEIGADEAQYARATPKIHQMINAGALMKGAVTIPMVEGRDYAYAIDRARFDFALWENALRFPTVTGRIGFSVTDLLWEDERVVGVIGGAAGQPREAIRARAVIGADGRYSVVARKAGAAERDEHVENPTSIYYAYWKNVPPYRDVDTGHEPGASAVAWGDGTGFGFLMMDSADDTVVVAIEGQSALINPPAGKVDEWYTDFLRRYPIIWERVKAAERITDVRGMKQIGNLYRQPGGSGWALVGDAYHQKDPIDGQGIYDAVFTAKVLASSLIDYVAGRMTWDAALTQYDDAARAETYAMYKSTLARIQNSLYASSPEWITRIATGTIGRWLFEDRLLLEQMGLMLTRQIAPNEVISAPLIVGALMRGPLRDLSKFLERRIAE
ncbi:MAG: NAD(P)/FAD-dependent oxidoreductase [Chloroflexota bacterium]|nr:NAD(P)/FAD-dependent oxidoreductase [Chloroflexota bacterium]